MTAFVLLVHPVAVSPVWLLSPALVLAAIYWGEARRRGVVFALLFLLCVAGVRKQKPRSDDKVSPRWIVQHAYDRTGDES